MKKLNNKIECKEGKIMGKKKLLAVMLTAVVATVGNSAGTMEVRAEEIVDIVMPMATLGEAPADLEKVEAKINEITEEKIGVHLVIEPIPFSDLSSQQNLMLSSGDQLDLVLSLWESGISNYVEKGAVIELTDLLDQYGKGHSGECWFRCCRRLLFRCFVCSSKCRISGTFIRILCQNRRD